LCRGRSVLAMLNVSPTSYSAPARWVYLLILNINQCGIARAASFWRARGSTRASISMLALVGLAVQYMYCSKKGGGTVSGAESKWELKQHQNLDPKPDLQEKRCGSASLIFYKLCFLFQEDCKLLLRDRTSPWSSDNPPGGLFRSNFN
jgi:hypothetical protein